MELRRLGVAAGWKWLSFFLCALAFFGLLTWCVRRLVRADRPVEGIGRLLGECVDGFKATNGLEKFLRPRMHE